MRNFLLGLPLSLFLVQAGFGNCNDTTLVVKSGSPGYDNTSGIYTPGAAGAINGVFSACSDSTMTVHLNFSDPTKGDTLKLANEITVSGRAGKVTRLVGKGTNDSIVTLVETNAADPQLLSVQSGNITQLSNFGFARKTIGNSNHSVVISAKGSTISGCHFWMADNSSTGPGALLEIAADSVLVERSLFRSPPDGVGRSTAVHTSGTSNKVEIRANVFFSTSLQLTATGSIHIFANTFAGSRNEFNCIIIGSGVTGPEKLVNIQHNLFAPKVDTLPPIVFSGSVGAPDSILKNAWSRSKANLALAINAAGTALTLNNTTGSNANTPLPRGFSNYGPNSPDVKDYPLTQLRSDPTLAANHPDFGKIFDPFTTTNWTTMQDIKDGLLSPRLYFPNGFSPFIAGKTWLASRKVGAFVDADLIEPPSPLDSGSQGSSLKFSKYTLDSTKIKATRFGWDPNYYKTLNFPLTMYFFFSADIKKLQGSNDSTALKATAGVSLVRKDYLNNDSLLVVPKEIRAVSLGGDIYVKMLHYRQGLQSPVLSQGVIATVVGVPSFPANDLQLTLLPSDLAGGNVSLNVTHGAEAIDSIRVTAAHEGGTVAATLSKPASQTTVSFAFTGLAKGNYYFYASPIAKTFGAGQPTKNSATVTVGATVGDTIYVAFQSSACPTATGLSGNPYCSLDSALKDIKAKNGGTILVRNNSPAVAMEDITIAEVPGSNGTDTSSVTIANTISSGKYDENRPIFRGKNKEALTITRKNVTLKGFVIEMPGGSTGKAALSVKASGAIIDGNIFRTMNKSQAVEGPAVNIDVGNAETRVINNVVWGITKAVQVTNSPSAGIRILNNTFLDDKLVPNTGSTIGVIAVGPAIGATVANNFFSNIAFPLDSASIAKKSLVLDHNVFTTGSPRLAGLTDAGALDSGDAARSVDLTTATYVKDLEEALGESFGCSSIHPCPSLQAASSSADYKTIVATDVFGRVRPATKKDVGAYEVNPTSSSVMGRIKVTASLITSSTFDKVNIDIASKNFDSLEEDSIYVWWTTATNGVLDNSIPANHQHRYPINKLNLGDITDIAGNLDEQTTYYIYAAFERAGTPTLGYVYHDSITTPINFNSDDCKFQKSDVACPSDKGYFVNVGGSLDHKFQTRITFTEKSDTNQVVKNPEFDAILEPNINGLNLLSPLPFIKLVIANDKLGKAGSTQAFRAQIDMAFHPDLSGKELFIVPPDSSSLPIHVSTWQLLAKGPDSSSLVIEGVKGGNLRYAFGKLADTSEPGRIEFTDASAPVFDYHNAGDTVTHIAFPIKGSGFKTANPLVLVSVVPAGGTVASGGSSAGVLSGRYPLNSLVLSADLVDLTPDLRKDRFYKYYLKAAGEEAASPTTSALGKPFTLDSVSASAFDSSVVYQNPNLSLSGGGALAATTLSIPMSKLYKASDLGRKASRSLEVVFTVFDGSKLARSRSFIRSKFGDEHLQQYDKQEKKLNQWNLYGYPWDESPDGDLSRIVSQPKWDPEYMRAMKYNGSGNGAGSFTIYDGSSAAAARFDSGQAVWTGSSHYYEPACVSGMSLDYQTFSLDLPAGQWTDISLPFNFPIRVRDIVDSSKLAALPTWYIYHDSEKTWERVTLATVINPWIGMTIKPAAALTLKFPVMDTSRSIVAAAPKAAATGNQWTADLKAFNGTATMALQIGMASREGIFSEPPDVPGQNFRVSLKRTGLDGKVEGLSQFLQTDAGTWQGHWPLKATAAAGSQGIYLQVSDNAKSVPLYLVETLHKSVVALGKEPLHIGEADLQANDYHLVAGDANYLDMILSGLSPAGLLTLSNYPNPFTGSTLIRYALPTSFGKVDYLLKVRDFRGRTVFEKTVSAANVLNFYWDGRDKLRSPLPAGVYTLSLEAKAQGKSAYKATRRLLKM